MINLIICGTTITYAELIRKRH